MTWLWAAAAVLVAVAVPLLIRELTRAQIVNPTLPTSPDDEWALACLAEEDACRRAHEFLDRGWSR